MGTITETKGGFKVENFRKLDEPRKNGILEPHVYEGIIKDFDRFDGKKDQYCSWDRFGRCSNWNREDCYIDVDLI